jgi:hypothetical protein
LHRPGCESVSIGKLSRERCTRGRYRPAVSAGHPPSPVRARPQRRRRVRLQAHRRPSRREVQIDDRTPIRRRGRFGCVDLRQQFVTIPRSLGFGRGLLPEAIEIAHTQPSSRIQALCVIMSSTGIRARENGNLVLLAGRPGLAETDVSGSTERDRAVLCGEVMARVHGVASGETPYLDFSRPEFSCKARVSSRSSRRLGITSQRPTHRGGMVRTDASEQLAVNA